MKLEYVKVGALVTVGFNDSDSKNVLITGFSISDMLEARKKRPIDQVREVAVTGMYFENGWRTVRFQHTMIEKDLGMLQNELLIEGGQSCASATQ
jgi:mannose/fructose/N-acetylgalactosamine-specific phosphotransferase system component IIB